ncbi:MAG: OmpA family protein [Flavobacteriaceae bacterium]|nr:OmpA family protein [Flavobacteriaceae bacterium]
MLLLSNILYAQTELKHEVYFETDKYEVPETEHNRLLLFILQLQKLNLDKISIYGFCDDRGTNSYNMTLSQNRADAIKNIFSNYDIEESIISNVDGKGEILLKIIETKDANIIRGLNRKVEIIASNKVEDEPEKGVTTNPNKSPVKKSERTASILKGNLKVGDKILLENILFKTNYSYVMPESRKTLEKIAKVLKERDNLYFTIQGHVCCTQNARDAIDKKTRKRNLSVARAKNIYDYLAKKGVDKRRMKYVGMRRKFPLGGDPKFDRRVEIVITYISENK